MELENGSVEQKGSNSNICFFCVQDEPMEAKEAVPFRSPDSMAREFTLPNCGKVRGMAVPRGVTIIVGGGFHGKSTLLQVKASLLAFIPVLGV